MITSFYDDSYGGYLNGVDAILLNGTITQNGACQIQRKQSGRVGQFRFSSLSGKRFQHNLHQQYRHHQSGVVVGETLMVKMVDRMSALKYHIHISTGRMNNINIKNKNSRGDAGARLSRIAMRGEVVFHAGDLANLWGIANKNTLYTTLSRYVAGGLIHRIYKGFYAAKNTKEIDPFLLGVKAIHSPAYVSCETILYQNGVLNQPPREITLVSRFSKHFSVTGRRYRSRKMRDEFLFNDTGIEMKDGVRAASLPRAVADTLYFNPRKYFDSGNSGLINWDQVKEVVDAIGYNIKIPKL